MFTKMCSCVNSSGAGPVEITQLRYLKTMLAIISCDRGKEPVFIWSFAVGKALNPFVPCACGHAVDAVHQEPHTSCQSFTGACGQLRGIPGASHCSSFTLDSPHLGNDTTEGPSQRQLCHWFGAGSCVLHHWGHTLPSVSSVCSFWGWKYSDLGNICFLWNIDRAEAVPALLPPPLAAEQTGGAAFPPEPASCSHQVLPGEFTAQEPSLFTHTGPASPLKCHTVNTNS